MSCSRRLSHGATATANAGDPAGDESLEAVQTEPAGNSLGVRRYLGWERIGLVAPVPPAEYEYAQRNGHIVANGKLAARMGVFAARMPPWTARAGTTMTVVVMKFGGTSVADVERIRNVARHVKREVDAGNKVAVVVSAMAGATNQLVSWVREASPLHDAREYDAVVASGEQMTAGLLAIVLQSMGMQARSWQGWQIPIIPSGARRGAHHRTSTATRLRERLDQGEVAVVTGFQGIEPERNRVATLGRGGSDTSAVAVAVALKAELCDIYTDVDGVYTTDPRIVPKARRLPKISYEEMLEMASLGLEGPADALGRTGDGAPGASARAVELRGARADEGGQRRKPGTRSARSYATRMRSWKSRSSAASPTRRTRPRSRS